MDPLFISNPPATEVQQALSSRPELKAKRVRTLLVTAFGEIFVETEGGEVWSSDPVELACRKVSDSVPQLEALFQDPEWAQERLMSEVLLLAAERGIQRRDHQVFGLAPHPVLTGSIKVEQLIPMDLAVWHHVAFQHA